MNKYILNCKELLGKHKKTIYLCIILIIIQTIVNLSSSMFSALYGINVALASKNLSKILISVIISFLLTIISISLFHYMYQISIKALKEIAKETKKKVFNNAIELDVNYHNHHASGGILNTIDYDVDLFCNNVGWTIEMICRHVLRIVLIFLLITILNIRLSLILWIIAPTFAIFVFITSKKQSKIHDKRREVNKKRISYINEGITGVKTIKSLNLEDNANKEFKIFNKTYFKYRMIGLSLNQATWRIFDIAFYGALALLFINSYKLSVSYGELYLYYNLFRMCLGSITELSSQIDAFSEEIVSIEKVHNLIHQKSLVKDKEITINKNDNLEGNISFKNITFKYPGGETVLTNFNLDIPSKTKVAIVGKTGSGKSTIASLLFRFYEPSKGTITIDNMDYTDLKLSYLHKQMGFILQEPLLFDDTILNNIKYGKLDASKEEVINACKLVGAHDFIIKQKDGYDTNIGEGGIILSMGQKQLLAFARVVLSNPSIIILDEATSNIDSQSEALIQRNIDTLFKDKTCLFIAHRLSTIKNVDNIIYLDKGKIIESGNHNQLLELNGKYATLYNNQFIESNIKKMLEK